MMQIGNFDIDKRVLVVAEIGNNHEGDFEMAKELIQQAAKCRVGAVKFQTFVSEHYVSQSDKERFARLKSFELSSDQFSDLADLAHSLGLLFISTPFDLHSAAALEPLVDAYKIASGDNDFYPLIEKVVKIGKPVIISTGIANMDQVRRTVDFVGQQRKGKGAVDRGELAILHCVAAYPVPAGEANLRSIPYLTEHFPGITVGYSDHTLGMNAAVAAVALEARIIEKHFTLDHNYSDFRDHQLSADPKEMKALVQRVREVEQMLGRYDKKVQPSEAGVPAAIRRSIVAARDLLAGYVIEQADITWVRPAGGLAPGQERAVVGKRLKRGLAAGEQLSGSDVEVAIYESSTVNN